MISGKWSKTRILNHHRTNTAWPSVNANSSYSFEKVQRKAHILWLTHDVKQHHPFSVDRLPYLFHLNRFSFFGKLLKPVVKWLRKWKLLDWVFPDKNGKSNKLLRVPSTKRQTLPKYTRINRIWKTEAWETKEKEPNEYSKNGIKGLKERDGERININGNNFSFTLFFWILLHWFNIPLKVKLGLDFRLCAKENEWTVLICVLFVHWIPHMWRWCWNVKEINLLNRRTETNTFLILYVHMWRAARVEHTIWPHNCAIE